LEKRKTTLILQGKKKGQQNKCRKGGERNVDLRARELNSELPEKKETALRLHQKKGGKKGKGGVRLKHAEDNSLPVQLFKWNGRKKGSSSSIQKRKRKDLK